MNAWYPNVSNILTRGELVWNICGLDVIDDIGIIVSNTGTTCFGGSIFVSPCIGLLVFPDDDVEGARECGTGGDGCFSIVSSGFAEESDDWSRSLSCSRGVSLWSSSSASLDDALEIALSLMGELLCLGVDTFDVGGVFVLLLSCLDDSSCGVFMAVFSGVLGISVTGCSGVFGGVDCLLSCGTVSCC